ncbi:hypothetical protein EVAR_102491_1 [Eumeta japonica]|uniref:Uncharacterized protein n=1 Tax=Eumeta variegata TaxID=151549 RepID=A0A4C1ZKV2_EUMVA|nr:hypothetical protein EVAR_102491_1 [Eumeta japonica]
MRKCQYVTLAKAVNAEEWLQQCKLWFDECTMSHKRAIEALIAQSRISKATGVSWEGWWYLADVEGNAVECLSVDNVMDTEQVTSYPIESLNSLELSGAPSHKLRLKVLRNPFASDPRSFVGAAISVILHIITTKRPKTVNVPDFNQPKNQAQADSEWGVDECGRIVKKLLMELGINKLGEAREILYVIEIEDTEHDIMSQVSNLVAPFLASTIQPASTHQVITFPDVHVSADEDMPSSSRTFRVSSPTEALLDPESGSSYDDSEFSDDDDAEYLVTSAKKEIQQNLSDDEELPPQRWHDTSNVEALTVWAQNASLGIPEDVKEMKKTVKRARSLLATRRCNGVGRMQNLIDD